MKIRRILFLIILSLFLPITVYADNNTTSNRGLCLVDTGNVFMRGEYILLGISPRGSFGSLVNAPSQFKLLNNSALGLGVNKIGFSSGKNFTTGDFLLPGIPEERFIIGYVTSDKDGEINEIKIAEKAGVREFPNPIEDLKTTCDCDYSTGLLKATTTGISKDNLKITITQELNINDKFFKTIVKLENLSDDTLSSVRYLRSINPDQDYDLYGTYKTLNKVISNPKTPYRSGMYALVTAIGPVSKEAFSYLSYDNRARVSIGNTNYPSSIYNNNLWIENDTSIPSIPTKEELKSTTGYTENDGYIAITFNLGELSPKENVTFEYYSSFSSTIEDTIKSIPVIEEYEKSIKIKNYPKSSNKKDILEISKLNIGDIIYIYSDSSLRNKLLTINVDKNNYKNNKLIEKLDKDILDDDGGIIYLKISSPFEESKIIKYNYPSTNQTSISLFPKRLLYILTTIITITLFYYIYIRKKLSNK